MYLPFEGFIIQRTSIFFTVSILPLSFTLRVLRRRQSGGFPGFEASGHGADVFVARLLQAFGCERGTAASAAMADDHSVGVGNFVSNVELSSGSAHVHPCWNIFLFPCLFVSYVATN